VEPARRAYEELGVKAVITGRRRSQGADRSSLPIVEVDSTGLIKVNPLANWSFAETKAYIDANGVPYNALLDRGYRSVGDWHSTKASDGSVRTEGGDVSERAGRWAGRQKTECGLHKDYFKMCVATRRLIDAEYHKN
jgi:phosphoadenosine phosphosulfate reductase